MKKRILTVISLILLLVSLLPVSTLAAGNSRKVIDNAHLLTHEEIADLNDRANAIADEYQMDVIILTVPSLGDLTPNHFADEYFDNNGYGFGPDRSGTIFVLSMEYRDWAVSTNGKAKDAFPKSVIDNKADKFVHHFSDGDYYGGFAAYLKVLTKAYNKNSDGWHYSAGQVFVRLLIALAIGAAVGGIVLLVLRYRMNTARPKAGAQDYIVPGSCNLHTCQDFYLYSQTTRSARPKSNSSSSGGSSSGGSSGGHGGSCGKF